MSSKRLLEKALLARRRGIINLVVFLIWEFVFKVGGILFLLYVFGAFLFNLKRVQVLGVSESIKEAATDSIFAVLIVGLLPAIIGGICIEYLHHKHK